jgi:hypothetical protein
LTGNQHSREQNAVPEIPAKQHEPHSNISQEQLELVNYFMLFNLGAFNNLKCRSRVQWR